MPDYNLSERARDKLLDIYDYTQSKFSTYQADAYQAGFEAAFQLLAKFPGISRYADEIRPHYRRYRYQSHYIYFTQEDDHIVIRNILHAAQNLRPNCSISQYPARSLLALRWNF